MSNVISSINNFDFDCLTLGNTQSMQGGGYFTRLLFNDGPFILQTPKCYTKKGMCKTGKKIYCDLKYSILEKNESSFIDWMEKLEEKTQDLIFANRKDWFLEEPTREDIEYMWNSCIRSYKSDFRLVRTFVQKPRQLHKAPTITIYDENEDIKSIDDITGDSRMITIIEILGIKWTSQSAQLDVCFRQAMLLEDKPLFTQCLITNNFNNSSSSKNNEETEQELAIPDLPTPEDDSNKVGEKIPQTGDNDKNSLDIQQSTNLFLDIKEKSDTAKDSDTAQDLSNKIMNKEVLDLEKNKEQDINKNEIETNVDIENSTPKNLEKADTDISDNEIVIDLEPLEKRQELHEIDIKFDEVNDSISLKNPNEVYIEIYKEAKKRAMQAKKLAIEAYLEAKRIKSVYLLDQFDSESESDSQFEDDELELSEEQ
jgi:hypothetical protein